MNFAGKDLSGDNLTLYEGAQLLPNNVVLVAHGTLDDCLPEEPKLTLLPSSPAKRKYGIGFLKPNEAYEQGKVVSVDRIEAIAGYGTSRPWEDFLRYVKLEALINQTIPRERRIIIPR